MKPSRPCANGSRSRRGGYDPTMRMIQRPSADDVAKGLELNEKLKRRIQYNVAEHGTPVEPDAQFGEKMAAEYGSTTDVKLRFGDQVARQLHILCPTRFEAP